MQKISIQKLKWLKSLHLKKNRDKEGLFINQVEDIYFLFFECLTL